MTSSKDGLSPKQERFVAEYLIDLNATQAAARAGYSPRTANEQGARLLANASIRAAVTEGQAKVAKKLNITVERIVAELAKIGFANMQDYMRVGPSGLPQLDFGALTRDQAAALQEVSVDTVRKPDPDGETDENGRVLFVTVDKVKFKLGDKRAALVDLGKHLGMFVEKHEHTGKDGGPIQTEVMSDLEVARRLAFLLAKGVEEAKQLAGE